MSTNVDSNRGRRLARLLVVEDDPAVLDIVQTRLEMAGYETHRARDGKSATDMLATMRPDAVVLDLSMPRMDGFAVLEWMARRSHTADIPVLVLTARQGEQDVRRAISAGASDYLAKPFRNDILLARVERLLRTRLPPSEDDVLL